MQSLFGLHTAKQAEQNIAARLVEDQFLPDLNSMEEQDKEQLAENRQIAKEAVQKAIEDGIESLDTELNPVIVDAIERELQKCDSRIKKLGTQYKKSLVSDTKKIYDQYIELLLLIGEFQSIFKLNPKQSDSSNFVSNKFIQTILETDELEKITIRKGISWQAHISVLRSWVKDVIRTDETFIEYQNKKEPSFEEDQKIVLYLYKSVLFKNETIAQYFEASDIHWSENAAVLKSMVLKTWKSIEQQGDVPLLMELSKNWEEDLLFLEKIFQLTLKHEEEYTSIIAEKSKNWEVDRIATTDRILLAMAVSEMINFPSIPVKVTINEYIELSKLYSTPKSKQYVNGILDVLSLELKKAGKIKKTGRGLLDNK